MKKQTLYTRTLAAFFAVLATAALCAAQEIASLSIVPDREDHTYAVGDAASLTISALDASGALVSSGQLTVDFANDRRDAISSESFDLAQANPITVEGALDRPGFLSALVKASANDDANAVEAWVGLAFSPEKIEVGAPRPDDFNEYWAKGQAEVRAIPIDVQQEKIESLSNENRDVFAISFASVDNGRVYGFLCVPKTGEGPYPAIVNVAWAGLGLPPDPSLADQGFVSLVMNVFPYPCSIDQQERERQYNEYNESLGHMYFLDKLNDRDAFFFRRPILGIDRAVDWLAEQEFVDASRIGYHGTSQGGGFGLILGGLNKNFKELFASVPAICDHFGYLQGRRSGWPQFVDENDRGIVDTARYYDAAYFAQNIEAPIVVSVGYIDQTCSPSSVCAAFNGIPSKDKTLLTSPWGLHVPDLHYGAAFEAMKARVKAR